MNNKQSDKRLCEVSLDDYRALGNGKVVANILNNMAKAGVPMYGVQVRNNGVSFITEEDKCDMLLQIAESKSTMMRSPTSFSVKRNLGLVVVEQSQLPMTMDSFQYLTWALSDCGIKILGVDATEKQTLIMVPYNHVRKAQQIVEQICERENYESENTSIRIRGGTHMLNTEIKNTK